MKINKTQRESLLQNENYKRYDEKKQELKNKYPQELFTVQPIGRPRIQYTIYDEKERELPPGELIEPLPTPNYYFEISDGHKYFSPSKVIKVQTGTDSSL